MSEKDNFIHEANEIHSQKYNYNEYEYKNQNHPSTIMCNTHGRFYLSPKNHNQLKMGCRDCSQKGNNKINDG